MAVLLRQGANHRPTVLVHGAWHGGWCWREVIRLLHVQGVRAFAPTLTGLGERAHLQDPVPTLATHLEDVIALIDAEELNDLVLVGHSYGGMVITGVADRLPGRIAHLVYVDAAVPADGDSMITQMPGITPRRVEETEAALRSLAPDGVWMAPPAAVAFGIPAEQSALIRWVERRLTPHPLSTWTEPLRLNGTPLPPRTYIHCTSPPLAGSAIPLHAARIRAGEAGSDWDYAELSTGHDAMVTAPDGLADLISRTSNDPSQDRRPLPS